jgi:hypothetical protein
MEAAANLPFQNKIPEAIFHQAYDKVMIESRCMERMYHLTGLREKILEID